MFKKKQKVIKILDVLDLKTATIQEIDNIKKGVIRIVGSGLTYDESGDEIRPVIPGCRSYLVCFDEGEEEKLK